MSLPLTPDEPTGTTSPLPPPISYTVFTSHTPTAVPLTPESLVSPQSSSDGEELDEVLSYFTDSSNDVAGQDFSSDGANYSSSHIYHESEYSIIEIKLITSVYADFHALPDISLLLRSPVAIHPHFSRILHACHTHFLPTCHTH